MINREEKVYPPVYLKITPTLVSNYRSGATCTGEELTKMLMGELEGKININPWWDDVLRKHFCINIEVEKVEPNGN